MTLLRAGSCVCLAAARVLRNSSSQSTEIIHESYFEARHCAIQSKHTQQTKSNKQTVERSSEQTRQSPNSNCVRAGCGCTTRRASKTRALRSIGFASTHATSALQVGGAGACLVRVASCVTSPEPSCCCVRAAASCWRQHARAPKAISDCRRRWLGACQAAA